MWGRQHEVSERLARTISVEMQFGLGQSLVWKSFLQRNGGFPENYKILFLKKSHFAKRDELFSIRNQLQVHLKSHWTVQYCRALNHR